MAFKVLIIDDDSSFRKLLSLRVKSFVTNPEFIFCGDLNSARKFLNQEERPQVDLVIIDQHLPDGKGTDLLAEGWFQDLAVLSVSSDDAPEIPGTAIQSGATYFLSKSDISAPLFKPLVQGLLDRNKLQKELSQSQIDSAVIESIKRLVGTLRHEINNPLGAVLGAAYLIRSNQDSSPEQREAAELVESSGNRIKHVLDKLCAAIEVEPVSKANQVVYHIPGDEPWEEEE